MTEIEADIARREMLDALAERITRTNRLSLELAQDLWGLMHSYEEGITFAEVAELLLQQKVSAPSKSQMSKMYKVYGEFIIRRSYKLDDLADIGIAKLYLIVGTPITQSDMWVERARTMTDDALSEAVREYVNPDKMVFKSIRVEEHVHEAYTFSREHLEKAVSMELSDTAFIELMATLIIDTSYPNLRIMWERLHGEGTEEDIGEMAATTRIDPAVVQA